MFIGIPSEAKRRHTVSVVIPCYNYGRYLRAAVLAALDQQSTDCEIIIVDDCSTDDSLSIAHEIARLEPRVKVLAHDSNKGHIATYNDGLLAAEGEFTALVSADDVLAPGALDRATAVMERHPRVGLAYGKVVAFNQAVLPPVGDRYRPGFWIIWKGRNWVYRVASLGYNPIMSPEAVVRTQAVRETGGFRPELLHSGDLAFWLSVATRWDVAQIRGVTQAFYRIHDDNMHRTLFQDDLSNISQKLAAFSVLLEEETVCNTPWVGRAHMRAHRALMVEAQDTAARALAIGDKVSARELTELAHRHASCYEPSTWIQRLSKPLRRPRGPDLQPPCPVGSSGNQHD